MKRCVSTDVGTWTNWLTFEPNPDSPDAGTGLLSLISHAVQREILLRRENPTYAYCRGRSLQRSGVVSKNGFIHREPWEHLCRRYVRSTECLLVIIIEIVYKALKMLYVVLSYARTGHSCRRRVLRLSSHAGIASKLMTVGSRGFHQRFFWDQGLSGTPFARALNETGIKRRKDADVRPINSYISEMIEDRRIVTMEG